MDSVETLQHILVVEDDPNTAEMLTAYFASLGYQVTHAAWGQDALTLAAQNVPDLVVLDIHLPDIDGYEVCSRLRSQRRTMNTPIIFLTERNERRDRLTGLELGAVDYLTKPFDVQEIRYRVRNILRRSTSNALLHPLTGLPTADLIEAQVQRLRLQSELILVGVRINGMSAFSDAYGFVSHDDILRAVALILRNTMTEMVVEDAFVGHLHAYDFVLIVPESQQYLLMGRLYQRLQEAISFFYPYQDWESGRLEDGTPLPKIEFDVRMIQSAQVPPNCDLELLRQALFSTPKN
ncbi:MAG: Alkaline phosphatase synthesis transcriptional regulatory protein PhoP [Chloroflexi bacterium ADurb.Bin360]|nr:MAG: Alkaline phosphatase synthesis transcriptional regulatory protein PhoP [Chloroflexi bacterium ADurb.Bin360]